MFYINNLITIVLLVLLIIFNIYIFYSLFLTVLQKNPPFVPTIGKRKKAVINEISEILNNSKKSLNVLDAGSGIGSILIPLAKKFKQQNFIGIELQYIPYKVSKMLARKRKNINFIHDDIFNHSFKNVDILYYYAIEQSEKKITEKMIKEMKKGTIIITNGSKLEGFDLIKTIDFGKQHSLGSIFVFKV